MATTRSPRIHKNEIEARLNYEKTVNGLDAISVSTKPLTRSPVKAITPAVSNPVVETEFKSLCAEVSGCTKCTLHKTRTQTVFGVGNIKATLMFIGEGPGADEDLKGEPFVGRAGQLLSKIITAMNLSREDVYIANIVKCRPPGNRAPEPEEIAACLPYLKRQITTVSPRIICTLGKVATETILNSDTPISKLRGNFHKYDGIMVMPTFHPAYLLRNPPKKREVWEDMQQIMKELEKIKTLA